MKTSEFIEYFEDEGFKVIRGVFFLSVVDEKDFIFIDIRHGINLDVDYSSTDLTFSERQEYYKVIFEYLMTPIKEREDEKKCYLRHKGFSDRYLTYDLETDKYYINLGIENDYYGNIKSKFTQSEIDNMPECYTHPAVWEQVESED